MLVVSVVMQLFEPRIGPSCRRCSWQPTVVGVVAIAVAAVETTVVVTVLMVLLMDRDALMMSRCCCALVMMVALA